MGIINLFVSCMECEDCHKKLTINKNSDVIYLTENQEFLKEKAFDRGWKCNYGIWQCPSCYKKTDWS